MKTGADDRDASMMHPDIICLLKPNVLQHILLYCRLYRNFTGLDRLTC